MLHCLKFVLIKSKCLGMSIHVISSCKSMHFEKIAGWQKKCTTVKAK